MKAVIFSFTRTGTRLGMRIGELLRQDGYSLEAYALQKFSAESDSISVIEPDLNTVIGRAFSDSSLLVFIGASGIAVRSIAPYIRDKRTDPAVLCIDEKGKYVIPLLSGHIGGANRITRRLAEGIGSQPVITTATDINGLLAIDEWAEVNDMVIGDMNTAKIVSANLLEGRSVGLCSEFQVEGEIPEYFLPEMDGEIGVCISLDGSRKPFNTTLNLIPRIVYLGIGCRKRVSSEAIEELVLEVLAENNISQLALAGAASIDLKEDERGLLDFSAKYKLPITFYPAGVLNSTEGEFTSSDFVHEVTGVDSVCERAAVCLSRSGKTISTKTRKLISPKTGKLISPKTARNGVTAALALGDWKVSFCNKGDRS